MSSRDKILEKLRGQRKPFPAVTDRPAVYIPVTRFGAEDRLERFKSEVATRFGTVHVATDEPNAIQIVLALLETDQAVIAWENLPLPGLTEALNGRQIQVVYVRTRDENRKATLQNAEKIRVGITGADAAFATTGTLALVSMKGQGRIPSLLPPVHIALLPRERIYEHLEDWFAVEGRAAMNTSRSIALVTGPSSTGDIEQTNVLGAHGPGTVHIVVF